MIDINDLSVAQKDNNKELVNNLLLQMFNEAGGSENNAIDFICETLSNADIDISRESLIGKLSYMGVKKIVKHERKAQKTAPKEPTKKELIRDLLNLLNLSVNDVTTLLTLKKADIKVLIEAIKYELEED